nr:RecName: Full=Light-harvesting protein B800/830/1020 beta-1 chain; AltName: Full=Antenna pigment protein beta-1 chain; AltName: Full=EHS-beta-1 [Halorhodospira halochloris]
ANDIRPLRDFEDEEAQEFHQAAVQAFFLYVAVAFVAHLPV